MAKKLRALVKEVSAERVQYKPYHYVLGFDGALAVEIELPGGVEIKTEKDLKIMSFQDFTIVLKELADQIQKMHDDYVIEARAKGKAI